MTPIEIRVPLDDGRVVVFECEDGTIEVTSEMPKMKFDGVPPFEDFAGARTLTLRSENFKIIPPPFRIEEFAAAFGLSVEKVHEWLATLDEQERRYTRTDDGEAE